MNHEGRKAAMQMLAGNKGTGKQEDSAAGRQRNREREIQIVVRDGTKEAKNQGEWEAGQEPGHQ